VIVDTDAVRARLESIAPKVAARTAAAVSEGAEVLHDAVRRNLSGDVLDVRSGALRDSIRIETDAEGARIVSDAPYARIQEYGGRIEIPEIVPVAARVLAFPYQGKLVFAAHTQAHAVDIPARPFMGPALEEFAGSFKAQLAAAIAEALA
jgi:HK97 gp10 family phage protein